MKGMKKRKKPHLLSLVEMAIMALQKGDYFSTSATLEGIYEILLKEKRGK